MDWNLLVLAFLLSSLLHFGVQKIFIYYKKFDDFNHRSSHNTLATRTGGIGLFTTLLFISLYYYFQGIELFDYSLFIPLGIMFVVGVYDDFYKADFKLKFLLQIIVAKILIDQGYVITNYHGLFGLYEVPWLLAQISTIFVFLIIVNAINFIDGIDGLAITEVTKNIILIESLSAGLSTLAPLGLLVVASILPLYYFNFKKKKKVFLGDGGSMFLGGLCMIYVLNTLNENFIFSSGILVNKTVFVILTLLYPLSDLLRVFILRIRNGKSPFHADNNHIHHKIIVHIKSHLLASITIVLLELLFLFFIYKLF